MTSPLIAEAEAICHRIRALRARVVDMPSPRDRALIKGWLMCIAEEGEATLAYVGLGGSGRLTVTLPEVARFRGITQRDPPLEFTMPRAK